MIFWSPGHDEAGYVCNKKWILIDTAPAKFDLTERFSLVIYMIVNQRNPFWSIEISTLNLKNLYAAKLFFIFSATN